MENAVEKIVTEPGFKHTLKLGNKNVSAFSYFNFSNNLEVLQKSLTGNENGIYDFRPLENAYSKLTKENRPFFLRHRGKFAFSSGLLVGMALMSIPFVCVLYKFPSYKK